MVSKLDHDKVLELRKEDNDRGMYYIAIKEFENKFENKFDKYMLICGLTKEEYIHDFIKKYTRYYP